MGSDVADDISLVRDDIKSPRAAVTLMDATFVQWGLAISTKKTKVLGMGRDAVGQSFDAVIVIRGEELEIVSQFTYLGSIFTSDGMFDIEIAHRVTVPLPGSIKLKSRLLRPYPCLLKCSFSTPLS